MNHWLLVRLELPDEGRQISSRDLGVSSLHWTALQIELILHLLISVRIYWKHLILLFFQLERAINKIRTANRIHQQQVRLKW